MGLGSGNCRRRLSRQRRPIAWLRSIPPPTAWKRTVCVRSWRKGASARGRGRDSGKRGRQAAAGRNNRAADLGPGRRRRTCPRDHRGIHTPISRRIERVRRRPGGEVRTTSRFLCEECGQSVTFPGGVVGMWRRVRIAATIWTCRTRRTSPLPAEPNLIATPPVSGQIEQPESPSPSSRTSTQLWIEVLCGPVAGLCSLFVQCNCLDHGLASGTPTFALCVPE